MIKTEVPFHDKFNEVESKRDTNSSDIERLSALWNLTNHNVRMTGVRVSTYHVLHSYRARFVTANKESQTKTQVAGKLHAIEIIIV